MVAGEEFPAAIFTAEKAGFAAEETG